MNYCDQHGWTEEDQEWNNPCICHLEPRHDGLHECGEGCGGKWAGGMTADRYRHNERHIEWPEAPDRFRTNEGENTNG